MDSNTGGTPASEHEEGETRNDERKIRENFTQPLATRPFQPDGQSDLKTNLKAHLARNAPQNDLVKDMSSETPPERNRRSPAGSTDADPSSTTHTSHTRARSSDSSVPTDHAAIDPEIDELLRFELNTALLHFVQAERPVVLENFGILCPKRKLSAQTHLMGSWGVLREEVLQTLTFEKCEDTSCLPESRFTRLVDTRELVQSVYSRFPLALQVRWSERELRRLVVAFFRKVRNEVIENGFSSQLRAVGQLYATHNRQGGRLNDWFAGADIFIVPRQVRPLSLRSVRRFPRPVLSCASELWEAMLGAPKWQGAFSFSHSLREIGFPERTLEEFCFDPDEVPVSIFYQNSTPNSAPGESAATGQPSEAQVVIVTDGLRNVARCPQGGTTSEELSHHGARLRHELVFRIPASSFGPEVAEHEFHTPRNVDASASMPNPFSPPSWVAQVLAAGSLLVASERANPLKANSALAFGRSLTGAKDCKLNALMAVPCPNVQAQQLAEDGPFHFANIIGITADEAKLIASHGRDHLLALLEARGLCNYTAPTRSSILARGYVGQKSAA